MLIRHEGRKLKPYRDTKGILTIGSGRNLEDVGISVAESDLLLDNDIAKTRAELIASFYWFLEMDPVRQDVLTDMAFMGVGRLLRFKKMISALAMHNYPKAASEMLASDWAKQVNGRAVELAEMMRTGSYPQLKK
jgi:lysozyme